MCIREKKEEFCPASLCGKCFGQNRLPLGAVCPVEIKSKKGGLVMDVTRSVEGFFSCIPAAQKELRGTEQAVVVICPSGGRIRFHGVATHPNDIIRAETLEGMIQPARMVYPDRELAIISATGECFFIPQTSQSITVSDDRDALVGAAPS